jgi:hypothetical protein
MARVCNPDANLPAVWLRHIELRSQWRHGLLDQWQHGPTLDDKLFRVAATIPITGLHLDKEGFLRELRRYEALRCARSVNPCRSTSTHM